MKREIRKMYLRAMAKILGSIIFGVLFVVMCVKTEELETVAIVVCGVLWGIAILIYTLSGIITIKHGTAQVKEYLKTASYSERQLETEYDNSKVFGSLHIGDMHIFANASDGFYVIPLDKIEKVWKKHLGENTVKGRPGYYYLYIKAYDMKDYISVYYIKKQNVLEAMECLGEKGVNTVEENI